MDCRASALTPPRASEPGGAGRGSRIRPYLAAGAFTLAALLWGSSFVLGKVALRELGVAHLLVYRFGIAALVLLAIVLVRRAPLRRRDLGTMLATGALAVPVTFLLQVGGLARTSAASAALIFGALPPLVAALSVPLGRERVGGKEWGALALSSLGVAILAGIPGPGRTLAGDGLIFLSLLATAAWVLLGKRLLARYGTLAATAYPLLFGTAILIPIALWSAGPPPVRLSPATWGAVAALGLGCTVVAYLLWSWGLHHVSAARAAAFANLEPLVGGVLAAVALGESLALGAWVGGALVVLAAILTSRLNRPGASPGARAADATRAGEAAPLRRRGWRASTAVGAAGLLAGAVLPAEAQNPGSGAVCGRVAHVAGRIPLEGVLVEVEGVPAKVLTAADGTFCIPGLPEGVARLTAQRLGVAAASQQVTVTAGAVARVEILMADRAVELPGITVTAEERATAADGSTASRIERAAIEHLQAASLADLLQLLPGQVTTNPTLSSARQSLLRQVPTTAEAASANALGTAVVMDGAPVSNNANLQTDVTILNASAGAQPPFSSVAGRGLDLRQISPDEIETVEVIRGIPSARHGDLTAGAILVETRVGARRPELRLRLNPTLLDANLSTGWGDGARRSGWSASGTLTRAQDDPRQSLDQYSRANLLLGWRSPLLLDGRLSTTVRLALHTTLDERRQDPGDLRYQRERAARDRGARLNIAGDWSPAWPRSSRVRWTASATVSEQEGIYQELVGRSISPVTTALIDTTVEGVYGPSEYLNRTTVHGQPVNLYARLDGSLARQTGRWRHQGTIGGEWRYDVNHGRGRQFDLLAPPRQNYSVGDRPRSYREVPALEILSVYAEDRVTGAVAGRSVELRGGLRLDNINPRTPWSGEFGTVLQPRLNASVEVMDGLELRLGYGTTAKAPPLSYLYPGPRYFDLVNFNHYAPDPAERLLVVTTRVVHPSNEGARAFTSRKREGGLSWRRGEVRGTVTAFAEETDGAYGWRRQLAAFPVEIYGIESQAPGEKPVLKPEPVRVDTFVSAYDAPDATRRIQTRGVEFTLDLPEWDALRTSFSLSGGWTRTRALDDAPTVDVWAFLGASRATERAGIYQSEGRVGERLVTSARWIHRSPAIGLVFSSLLQTVWWEHDRRIGVSELPVGYVERSGREVALTPEEARLPAYADLLRPVSAAYLAEERRPPLWLLNLRLAKALPAGLELSFFANNALGDRPLYQSRRTEAFERRNPPLAFGLELVSRLGR